MRFGCGICSDKPGFATWDEWSEHSNTVHPDQFDESDEMLDYDSSSVADDMAYWYNRELEAESLGRPLFPNEY